MSAAPPPANADLSIDRNWFEEHPDRLYRARAIKGGAWVIRRSGPLDDMTIVHAWLEGAPPPDDEKASELAWLRAAYPDVGSAPRKAKRRSRRRTA
jgi:hypothetical protein